MNYSRPLESQFVELNRRMLTPQSVFDARAGDLITGHSLGGLVAFSNLVLVSRATPASPTERNPFLKSWSSVTNDASLFSALRMR
jgi:hypothetical protein